MNKQDLLILKKINPNYQESNKSNYLLPESEFYGVIGTNSFNAQLAITSSKLQVEELLVCSGCLQISQHFFINVNMTLEHSTLKLVTHDIRYSPKAIKSHKYLIAHFSSNAL